MSTSFVKPADAQARGETEPAAREREDVAELPHERDQSASSQPAGEPSAQAVGRAGHADLERGVVDTTKAAELDRAYRKLRGA